MGKAIYVETFIRGTLDQVWERTQSPDQHVRWDVRFSRIRPTEILADGTQRFLYERRTPFHTVRGDGVSLGERERPDGTRTSALRFDTADPLSPLQAGRGYWRYVPVEGGVRFITGYDYVPGWGPLDAIVRPLVGWATAWSFDRLRLWIERGDEPERWPLGSVLWLWRAGRPRAVRCRRTPPGRRSALDDAPDTLAVLPSPGVAR